MNDKDTALEIANYVVENGRVEGDGDEWIESLRVEVEFEADERGLENSTELAELAVESYQ